MATEAMAVVTLRRGEAEGWKLKKMAGGTVGGREDAART